MQINTAESRSPWAALSDVKSARLDPLKDSFSTQIAVPGSKSVTNRALIIAAAAEGESKLTGILRSDDSYWCIDALKRLGVKIEETGEAIVVNGTGPNWPNDKAELFIGSAGTIARFLPGVVAAAQNGEYIIRGSEQLSGRPLNLILNSLQQWGAGIASLRQPGHLPIGLKAMGLKGGATEISGEVSSQFISGLLIAAPLSQTEAIINVTSEIVHQDYVQITLDTMKQFGVTVDAAPDLRLFKCKPQSYKGQNFAVEADASTATYFMALAAATGGKVTIANLPHDVRQPDIKFLDILEQLGCAITKDKTFVTVKGPEKLKGNIEFDMSIVGDATLTLVAIAPYADGPITIRNVESIRKHECDRITVPCEILTQLGIQVEEFQDGMKIYPGQPKFGKINTHDDHRIAMAFAVLGLVGEGIELSDPGCVSKTCPVFFDLLSEEGVGVSYT